MYKSGPRHHAFNDLQIPKIEFTFQNVPFIRHGRSLSQHFSAVYSTHNRRTIRRTLPATIRTTPRLLAASLLTAADLH